MPQRSPKTRPWPICTVPAPAKRKARRVGSSFSLTGCYSVTLVGAAGFEPATTRTPSVCATRLRHAPTERRGRIVRRLRDRLLVPPIAIASSQGRLGLLLGRDARTPLPVRAQIDREGPRIARLID